MIFDELEEKEEHFHKTLVDSYGKKFTIDSSAKMPGATRLTHKNDNWYYKAQTKKDKIVLHFTAGILHGDVGELTKSKVSVAYVIPRYRELYELFDPKYWAYHLGANASGGNMVQSKSSIAIEISNYGPLTLKDKILWTWSKKAYCTLDQTDAYTFNPKGFRGYKYFATYTDYQYKTLDSLITNLCREYKILRKLPDEKDRFNKIIGIPKEGIWSHQNFRSDKSDVGLAFDWSRITGM